MVFGGARKWYSGDEGGTPIENWLGAFEFWGELRHQRANGRETRDHKIVALNYKASEARAG